LSKANGCFLNYELRTMNYELIPTNYRLQAMNSKSPTNSTNSMNLYYIIIDGRNLLEPKRMKELGFNYRGVGRQ